MLLTKEITIELKSSNIKWYENKGYIIPRIIDKQGRNSIKMGTKITVKVGDLQDNSKVLVDAECDGCGEILNNLMWYNYKKYVKNNGKYYCQKCAINGYKKWVSFFEWCYAYLPKEEADKIMDRWDNDRNVDKNGNVLSPKDITYASPGFNKKGYWFKCLDHAEHESEQKNINSFTSSGGSKERITCNQCNTIAITHPHLIKFLTNKENALKYSHGSNIKISMTCPDCGYEKKISINQLIGYGFGCSKCGDGIKYPEKFLFSLFEQLTLNFITQLTKTTFKWIENYKYDFYIKNCIVETHGMQHYEDSTGKFLGSLYKIQENDKDKEQLAKQNSINDYIVIDCRYSTMEWIKNNIMNRDPSRLDQPCLAEVLNFKQEDIDWLKCHEYACSNLVKSVCKLWNNGSDKISYIVDVLKINRNTIRKYLKQGSELGWCNYDANKEKNKNYSSLNERNQIHCKTIMCVQTKEIYDSISDACEKTKINNISLVCNGKRKYAGRHPETGEKLTWEFVNINI